MKGEEGDPLEEIEAESSRKFSYKKADPGKVKNTALVRGPSQKKKGRSAGCANQSHRRFLGEPQSNIPRRGPGQGG